MIIKEYRIAVPLTMDEYKIGQRFTTMEITRDEVGKGSPIKILVNQPFNNVILRQNISYDGQYTRKTYCLSSKVPRFWRRILPRGPFNVDEDSWNAFPYTKTVLTSPALFKGIFKMTIESIHYPDNGKQENIHQLPADKWKSVEIVIIDIANDHVRRRDYKEKYDPTKFKSIFTGRGPLSTDWRDKVAPIVTSYKLVSIEFKVFGFQSSVEKYLHKVERKMFLLFHRRLFCSIDDWCRKDLSAVNKEEAEFQEELEKIAKRPPKKVGITSVRSVSQSSSKSQN